MGILFMGYEFLWEERYIRIYNINKVEKKTELCRKS